MKDARRKKLVRGILNHYIGEPARLFINGLKNKNMTPKNI